MTPPAPWALLLVAALVAVTPAAAVDLARPGGPRSAAAAGGITVTSPCTSTLSVATSAEHPRFDYRVVSGGRVLVPVSWVGEGLVTSLHYLTGVRRHDPLTVEGTDGTRLTVQASPRKCR